MSERFELAQAAYLASEGAPMRSRFLELSLPGPRGESRRVRTHVLTGGEGPPLFMLHGGGGLAASWGPLMARLAEEFTIIAPDRPGGGLSDGFDYRGVDFEHHAASFVEGVLDAFELESAPFVANSMGARWTTWLALRSPERVQGIAALGMPALILDTSAPVPMRLLGVPGVGRLMMALEPPGERAARTLWHRMGHDTLEPTPEMLEICIALTAQPTYGHTWRTLIGRVASLGGARPGLSLDGAQLAGLEMPLAFAIGDHDPFGSLDVGRRAASLCADATFEVVGRGHLPWLDDADGCARVVRALVRRVGGVHEGVAA